MAAIGVLMAWGPLQFSIHPLNYHEMVHRTSSDYARKDVLDAPPRREYVGEGDEIVTLRGRVFPRVTGGFVGTNSIQRLEAMRRQNVANQLIRGGLVGGENMGWFVLELLDRVHTHIDKDGKGRVINFDANFARVDIPDPAQYATDLFSTMRT